MKRLIQTMLALAIAAALATAAPPAASKDGKNAAKAATADAKEAKKAAKAAKAAAKPVAPTAAEISDAKAKGLVWANLNTKVYHKDGQHFGTTKNGKFMTEAEATKEGFKAAKESPIGKGKAGKNVKLDKPAAKK